MANLQINNNYNLITLLIVLHILAIILFLNGFLTVKSTLKGFSTLEEQREKLVFGDVTYNATINRVVLMVIDALRVDFVLGENGRMEYVQNLLETHQAVAFRAKVDVPTVTLPRIKAMMTGSIPGFIDVVLNLGSSQLDEDNLLSQARSFNKNIVFYGDDTWQRLFPHHFLRSEGTTSFFVNDYTEVDNNVTNNLLKELEQPDWDIMILHYLGLDHIGHTAGPESALIGPKLKEMDDIVKIIHDALVADEARTGVPNLLVICGDHGMSDAGGHGGSSSSETTVPVIFSSSLAPRFTSYLDNDKDKGEERMDEIWQVDLCPTLSVLLGLPIPKNNVGKVIPSLTAHLRWHERLTISGINCHQVLDVSHHLGINTLDSRLRFAEDFHNMTFGREFPGRARHHMEFEYQYYRGDLSHVSYVQRLYNNVLNDAKEIISSKLVHHDVYAMLISIIIQWQVFVLAVCLVVPTQHTTRPNYFKLSPILNSLILYLFASATEDNFQFQFDLRTTIFCFYLVSNIAIIKQTLYRKSVLNSSTQDPNKWILKGLILGFTLHAFSLMASSFVEEEHQTWYFFSATVQLAIILQICQGATSKRLRLAREKFTSMGCLVVSLALLRLQRDWNHTGDKWAHLPDITDWLDGDDGKLCLTALVIISFIAIVAMFSVRESWFGTIVISINAIVSCCHKSAIGSIKLPLDITSHRGITEARMVYCGIAVYFVSALLRRADRSVGRAIIVSWIQLSCLLARAQNVPLLALMVIQERLVRKGCSQTFQASSVIMACVYYIMAQCSYFQQGNSHSLARVDLHGGYVGLDSYVPALVAILLTCSTYAGPIFWILSLSTAVANTRFKDDAFKVSVVMLICRAMPWSLYAPCVLFQRFHLFVWTVFSPKLLFEGMFSLVYLFLTCVLLVTSFTLKF